MKRIREDRDLGFCSELQSRIVDGDDPDVARITGYGSVFGRWYEVWGFRERIAAGAFDKTLRENRDITGMFNHDAARLLGRTGAGTMTVESDKKGLAYEILADLKNSDSANVVRMIARGDVKGSSMAFFVHKEEWETDKDNRPTKRTIKEVELIETGPVVMPASGATSVKIQRALEETGIDFDGLQAAIVKHRAGFAATAAEVDLIERTIERLRGLASEPNKIHSDADTSLTPALEQEYGEAVARLRMRVIDSMDG